MGFIRIKKINGKEYAYLVENKWFKRKSKGKSKGSRQKVSKYLGKVHYFDKTNNDDFLNFKKINNLEEYLKNHKNQVIKDLVEWELYRHNIGNGFTIDFNAKKITKNNKEATLRINEGYLNGHTLSRLFIPRSNDSYYLAKCFVDAGIEIPKELFAGLFSKNTEL